MKDNEINIANQLKYLEALIEVLPRENYIKLYDIICNSEDEENARKRVMEFFEFTESQAQCVCEMKLTSHSLEEATRLKNEYRELVKIKKALEMKPNHEKLVKESESLDYIEAARNLNEDTNELYAKEECKKRKIGCDLEKFDDSISELGAEYDVLNITNSVRGLIGSQVKYAAVSGKIVRPPIRDSLIEGTESGFVLNPNWEGSVYILFENGAEIEVSGSDYVSVRVRNDHM